MALQGCGLPGTMRTTTATAVGHMARAVPRVGVRTAQAHLRGRPLRAPPPPACARRRVWAREYRGSKVSTVAINDHGGGNPAFAFEGPKEVNVGLTMDTDVAMGRDTIDIRELNQILSKDKRVLPKRIILVRHGESMGNVDETIYSRVPDPQIRLTDRGREQAKEAGQRLRGLMEEADGENYQVVFYMSPYMRSKQTCKEIVQQFPRDKVAGLREEVQLREQDFGNFQDTKKKVMEKKERNRYGRFYYRFPNGESGADVYDRITIFEDHLVHAIDSGEFADNSNLVMITHGLTLRIFLARWFHWTVKEFEEVYNPSNSDPIILERAALDDEYSAVCTLDGICDPENEFHTKNLYQLTEESIRRLKGCTSAMGKKVSGKGAYESLMSIDDVGDEEWLDICDLTVDETETIVEECETNACARDAF